jgi:hypothetical protein
MAPRWLSRVAVLATITATTTAASLIPSGVARADAGIPLVGDLPTTATRGQGCADWASGSYARQDLWRFEITEGEFRELTLEFTGADGAELTRTVAADTQAQDIGEEGVDGDRAWVSTAPGATLVAGWATVTGEAEGFTLAQTCAAEPLAALAPQAGKTASVKPNAGPRALAGGVDVMATMAMGITLVLAGAMLLIVRRHPRGRHRTSG